MNKSTNSWTRNIETFVGFFRVIYYSKFVSLITDIIQKSEYDQSTLSVSHNFNYKQSDYEQPYQYLTKIETIAMTTKPSVIGPQLAAPQPWGQAPQQIAIVSQPSKPVHETYKAELSRRFGWTLIAVGMLAMIFNIANLAMQRQRSYYGASNWPIHVCSGMWCGCFYIISGGLGIGAGQRRTTSMIRGNLGMGVFGVLCSTLDLILNITALAIESTMDYGSDEVEEQDRLYHTATLGLSTMGMLVAATAVALCIASCELAGKVLCTGKRTTPQQTFMQTEGQIQTIPGSGQQVMVLNIPQAGQSAAGFQNNAFSPQGVPLAHTPPPSYVREDSAQELPQNKVV